MTRFHGKTSSRKNVVKKKSRKKKVPRFVWRKGSTGSGKCYDEEYVGEVSAVFWSDWVVEYCMN